MSKWVLGLNLHHDASACLTRDGEPFVALAQERLSRNKHAAYVRNDLVDYCLDAAGIGPRELDMVVLTSIFLPTFLRDDPRLVWKWYEGLIAREFGETFHLAEAQPRVEMLSHHLAHAYAVFGASGWDEAAVLVVDWAGSSRVELMHPRERHYHANTQQSFERERVSLYHFERDGFRVVDKQFSIIVEDNNFYRLPLAVSDGIGGLYEVVGRFIFGKGFAAGKVMGLAPYGQPSEELLAEYEHNRFRLNWEWLRAFVGHQVPVSNPMRYANLAASAQVTLEHQVLHLVRRLHEETGSSRLAFSGGVALNGKVNERLEREGPFKEVFVLPASGDSGAAIGAALYGNTLLKAPASYRHTSDYQGREYAEAEMERALEAEVPLISWRRLDGDVLYEYVASRLAEGLVVGWFQGRSEFGPRALGNRSILADARYPDMKDTLNLKVKHREPFRPFAPVVLAHRAKDVFHLDRERPFMLFVDGVRPRWREKIPSVVHVDGSARVQTVTESSNPRFFALLSAFEKLTGVPLIINTSFNCAGEPIVERPEEAVDILRRGKLDLLVLGNYVASVTPPEFDAPPVSNCIPMWAEGIAVGRRFAVRDGALKPEATTATIDNRPSSAFDLDADCVLVELIDGKRTVAEILASLPEKRAAVESKLHGYLRAGVVKLSAG